MSEVSRYLDCGCAILRDGSRSWCPSCTAEQAPPAPRTERTYSAEEVAEREQRAFVTGSAWGFEQDSYLESECEAEALRRYGKDAPRPHPCGHF